MISRRRQTPMSKFMTCLVKSILERGNFGGKYIKKFEIAFSKYIGTKYAIAVPSGKVGLRFLLENLNLKTGDEVIFPVYTLEALPKIVLDLGLKPVFVDIDTNTLNIDTRLLNKKITKKTKVIIATHLFGFPCNIKEILRIAKSRNIKVIEDCAHSLGATYDNKIVGSFGYASYFSFELIKGINTFGGGIILTNNLELYTKLKKKCSSLPKNNKRLIKKIIFSYIEKFVTEGILSNLLFPLFYFKNTNSFLIKLYKKTKTSVRNIEYAYTDLQAFLGLKQLQNINRKIEGTLNNAQYLTRLLKKEIPKQKAINKTIPVYYHYIIRYKNLERLYKKLLIKRIDTSIYDEIMDNCGIIFDKKENYPNMDKVYNTAIQIPIYNQLKKKEICYIAKNLNNLLESP